MVFTHAELRLKPLGDSFQASTAETNVHKRSHSYSGYIPYYPQPSTTILTIRYVADAVFRLLIWWQPRAVEAQAIHHNTGQTRTATRNNTSGRKGAGEA